MDGELRSLRVARALFGSGANYVDTGRGSGGQEKKDQLLARLPNGDRTKDVVSRIGVMAECPGSASVDRWRWRWCGRWRL